MIRSRLEILFLILADFYWPEFANKLKFLASVIVIERNP